jgi:hypothetical protein
VGYLLKSSPYAILLFFYSMLYCKYLRNDRSRPRNRSGFVVEEIGFSELDSSVFWTVFTYFITANISKTIGLGLEIGQALL